MKNTTLALALSLSLTLPLSLGLSLSFCTFRNNHETKRRETIRVADEQR
jgi:hypothetical protein